MRFFGSSLLSASIFSGKLEAKNQLRVRMDGPSDKGVRREKI